MTSLALRNASPTKIRVDAVVVGVLAGTRPMFAPGADDVASAYGRKLAPLLAGLGVSGKAGEVTRIPTGGAITAALLVLVGLGTEASETAVRRAAGNAARSVGNAASVALALPADSPRLVAAVTEGFLLGGYSFTRYKSAAAARASAGPAEIVVLSPGARRKDAQSAFEEAQVLAAAVATTRDWVNTPPADLTPPDFADEVVAAVKAYDKDRARGATKVRVSVREEDELVELGCGGLLGVSAGSAAPPRLVELSYAPKGAVTHLALVGKGITYDSGGLTIKPGNAMKEMKSDMAGAAAVVSATLAIARLGLPIRITTYAAMAENMLGEAAMRPGDVLTIRGGTTVEVTNTDAEGRLVLADALVLATEQHPDLVVDVATLTGAMVVALGDRISGVMGSADVVDRVLAAGEEAGEELWPMPIPEFMTERIRTTTVADLSQSDWIRWGAGLFAAAFLREFTGGLPWAHLDIAGPAFASGGPSGHVSGGGTGVGVATLVELARGLSEAAAD